VIYRHCRAVGRGISNTDPEGHWRINA
jgi:hypothetical protein